MAAASSSDFATSAYQMAQAFLAASEPAEAAGWVRDGWSAVPGTKRARRYVIEPQPPKTKAAKAASGSTAAIVSPPVHAVPTLAAVHSQQEAPLQHKEPLLPRYEAIADGTGGWTAHGWMAEAGVSRVRVPVLPPDPPKPPPQKREKGAEPMLAVGSAVEARWQASLPGVASSTLLKQCHYHPGTIEAVDEVTGTYTIRYDDGDYEEDVKRRFVRRSRPPKVAPSAAPVASALDDDGVEEELDAWALHAASGWRIGRQH